MLDEKSGKELPLAPDSTFSLTNIINESTIPASSKKNAIVSPFSNMLSRRVMGKSSEQTISSQSDLEKAVRSSGKEVVIRFGLNRGFGGKALSSFSRNLNDNDYPDLNDLAIDLKDNENPISQNFNLLQAAISTLGTSNKKGDSVGMEDIGAVIEAFSNDMADGKPDGKASDGSSLSINGNTLASNPISCGGDPSDPAKQKSCVMGGAYQFASEGGVLPGGVKLDTNAIKSQAQAMVSAETATILSPDNPTPPDPPPTSDPVPTPTIQPPAFSFSGSISLNVGIPFSITPSSTGGNISSCTIDPALPSGIALSSTCVLSGIPSGTLSSTSYSITGTNSSGSATISTSITISYSPPSISTATSYSALDQGSFTLSPSLTGAVTSCVVQERFWNDPDATTNDYWDYRNYTLPYGLSINPTTCVISGTVSIPNTSQFNTQTSPYLRIVATNPAGTGVSDSDPATINNEFQIIYTKSPATFSTISNQTYTQGQVVSFQPVYTGSTPNCYLYKDNLDPVDGVHNGTLSAVTLPTGLSFNSSTCTLSGTPSVTSSALENLVILGYTGASLPAGTLSYSGYTNYTYTNRFSITVNPSTFTIGGTVSGLTGGSLTLEYRSTPTTPTAEDTLVISANGAYAMAKPPTYKVTVTAWNNYEATKTKNLTISAHPPNQYCIFDGAYYNTALSATVNANLTNMNIRCYPKKYTFQPDYASYGGDIGGIAGADAKCNAKGSGIGITSSKAFLFLAGTRQACDNATSCLTDTTNRIDYPLSPNTIYLGKGGSVADIPIFITDSYGIISMPNGILNLINSTNMAFSHVSIWTGFSNQAYSVGGDNTCGSWNYSGGGLASYGASSQTNGNFIRNAATNCYNGSGSVASFLCLEQ